MTSSTSSTSGAKARDRRRFPRYDVEIPVFLRKKTGDHMLVTADVSRHGAFLKSDVPQPVRQLVQLRFRLPDHSEIDAMCMVARWLPDSPRGAGFGVDFFALSKEAKAAWERFLADLRARDAALGFDVAHTPTGSVALPPNLGTPLPPARAPVSPSPPSSSLPPVQAWTPQPTAPVDGVPEWMAPNSLTAGQAHAERPVARRQPPPLPAPTPSAPVAVSPPQATLPTPVPAQVRPLPPPPPPDDDDERPLAHVSPAGGTSVVMLRMADRDGVKAFIDNEVSRGGMFLKTALIKEVGEKIDVVLVHPETDDEFHLEGTVVRRVINGPPEQRGLGIFFRALSKEAHDKLVEFADSGVEVVELANPISQRQLELEAAVAREPDSAEALEALGSFLLDEEGDLGGALTALTRALVLGPSQVSIHASLARAYRKIGDHVKVRAHERVAEALMLHQDRLKVRLGVGDLDDA